MKQEEPKSITCRVQTKQPIQRGEVRSPNACLDFASAVRLDEDVLLIGSLHAGGRPHAGRGVGWLQVAMNEPQGVHVVQGGQDLRDKPAVSKSADLHGSCLEIFCRRPMVK